MKIDQAVLLEGLNDHFSVGPAMDLWDKVKTDGPRSIYNGSLVELIYVGLSTVERLARDTVGVAAGNDKLDALLDWLDDVVKLPFWMEPFDRKIFKMIIEAVIGFLNRRFGKDWLTWAEGSEFAPSALKKVVA